MKRQPRNPKTDKLVNERLISMAYGQIGERAAKAAGEVGLGSWASKSGIRRGARARGGFSNSLPGQQKS